MASALLKKFNIEFNVLVTVTNEVSKHPHKVYQFLKAERSYPCSVQSSSGACLPNRQEQVVGLTFAQPGKTSLSTQGVQVSPYSVAPAAYGEFLVVIFDEMGQTGCRYDVRNEFRVGTGFISAPTGNVCLFTENCGKALILEHNGDVYSCDHFMYPEHRLGNIKQTALMALANSPQQQASARRSRTCPTIAVVARFARLPRRMPEKPLHDNADGQPGLNYLCPSYKRYFNHIAIHERDGHTESVTASRHRSLWRPSKALWLSRLKL